MKAINANTDRFSQRPGKTKHSAFLKTTIKGQQFPFVPFEFNIDFKFIVAKPELYRRKHFIYTLYGIFKYQSDFFLMNE